MSVTKNKLFYFARSGSSRGSRHAEITWLLFTLSSCNMKSKNLFLFHRDISNNLWKMENMHLIKHSLPKTNLANIILWNVYSHQRPSEPKSLQFFLLSLLRITQRLCRGIYKCITSWAAGFLLHPVLSMRKPRWWEVFWPQGPLMKVLSIEIP